MSASPQDPSDSHFVFRLPRKALQIVGIAAGVGFLLFLLAWWLGRDDGFYTVEPTAKAGDAGVEALPAPLPGDGDGASGLEEPRQPAAAGEEAPAVVETAPMPPPVEEMPPAPPPAAPAATPAPPAGVALAPGDVPAPIPGRNPPPEYPTRAMRRGDTGTVTLRVTVGADGVPTDIEIADRSGSRDLDRAAIEAVRRWRFRPAQRNGQPVAASVDIPITFDLQR
ncbi:energy transducer TonB [Pseudoxanthomonas sangjuensis]|uniref:energy transducer TonB n=1 Tax=Pseudoxanthomonas sangjuensis TaxID=1503750 RepID=UPI00139186E6|nr:energy transducer TonB [Pseudoxanthomonas sangjuensis]KAF1707878.1 energy transducer TonB [Pseudoxanthomonas sangjuensis]